jgi:hypothetical protein
MKYNTKGTILLGYLPIDHSVTITLVNIKTDTLINVSSNICNESTVQPGLYYFNTNNIIDEIESVEIAYIMKTDVGETYGGKIVIHNELIDYEEIMNRIPKKVWNDLNIDDTTAYKDLIFSIYSNAMLIPS